MSTTAPRPSPSFAVEAVRLLADGRQADAVRLCADGIRYYPDYLGGYIVLSDAYAALGYDGDARLILDEAHRRFPWNRTVALRLDELATAAQESGSTMTVEPDSDTMQTMTAPAIDLAYDNAVAGETGPVSLTIDEPTTADIAPDEATDDTVGNIDTTTEIDLPSDMAPETDDSDIDVISEVITTDIISDGHAGIDIEGPVEERSDAEPITTVDDDDAPSRRVQDEAVREPSTIGTVAADTSSAASSTATIHELRAVHHQVSERTVVRREVPSVLRIIDTAPTSDDARIIRSSAVRLIPGLEYTTLRFEGMKARGRRAIQPLSEPPSFRDFHSPMRPFVRPRPHQNVESAPARPAVKKPLSLEELASRLEKVRMPRPGESTQPPVGPVHTPGTGPALVTETIARIYEQQGALEKALEAYRALQRQKPDKHAYFERLIADVSRKMQS